MAGQEKCDLLIQEAA